MDKKLMNLLGVWLFAVASVCALTACSDNDTENPEGEKTGGENGKPTPETVEFINSTWCTGEMKTEWGRITLYSLFIRIWKWMLPVIR